MEMKTFDKFKDEILKRSRKAYACKEEYKRALKSETFDALMLVIKDNFDFASNEEIIDPDLIENYKEEFANSDIYCNEYTEKGFLLVSDFFLNNIDGNVVVNVLGNSTIHSVCGNAMIRNVSGDSTIHNVWGNATIHNVCGNATIHSIWGNATIHSIWGNATIHSVSGNAMIRDVSGDSTIHNVWGNATIHNVCGNATIRSVRGNAYISSMHAIKCNLYDNAILRIRDLNIIRYVSNNIKMEKQA